jgi:hypothetical protein
MFIIGALRGVNATSIAVEGSPIKGILDCVPNLLSHLSVPRYPVRLRPRVRYDLAAALFLANTLFATRQVVNFGTEKIKYRSNPGLNGSRGDVLGGV